MRRCRDNEEQVLTNEVDLQGEGVMTSVPSVCWGSRRCRRRQWASGPVLALTLSLLLCSSTASALRWFGRSAEEKPVSSTAQVQLPDTPEAMLKWQQLMETSDHTAFEDAFELTYGDKSGGSGDAQRTLDQYESMVQWFTQSSNDAYTQIHELRSYTVRELVYDAMQLASKPFNETAALTILEYISSRLTQLPPKYGYPAARRVILGALLSQRVKHGPFTKPVQRLVDKVLLHLFQLHKRSIASKGAVQFFHISKSGGTNLCQSAQSNGCSTEGFDERTNCLIRSFVDTPRWVAQTPHKYLEFRLTGEAGLHGEANVKPWFINFHSNQLRHEGCAERAALLRANGWDFYANEYTLPPGESSLCKEFVNLMMWRHPLERLRSQISWIQKLYKNVYKAQSIKPVFQGRTSSFWEKLLPGGVNNYFIRSLLGGRFFEFPLLGVNETHVERAKVQVLLHDLLLTLEEKHFNDITLKVGLGWSNSLAEGNIRSSSDMADEISMPADYKKLEARNAPDVRVYEFARELQALDVLLFSFVQALDTKLGIKNLSSTQCGYVSLDRAHHAARALSGEDTASGAAPATAAAATNKDGNGSVVTTARLPAGTKAH